MNHQPEPLPQSSAFRNCAQGVGLCLLMAFCFGCSPPTEQEQEYFEKRAQEREAMESTTQNLKGSTRHAEAMSRVKECKAPDGKGTIEDWVNRKVEVAGGNALFPRWKARPRGGDKFEIRYEYTLIDENYDFEKKGYAWTVDLMLKVVSPHRELTDAEIRGAKESRMSQISRQQRRERQKEEEFSLE